MSENGSKTNRGLAKKDSGMVEEQQQPSRRVTYTPRVDILETPEEMWLYVDMPGVKASDVEVKFERGELTVQGKTAQTPPVVAPKGQLLMQELEPGDFYRAFLISQDIATDKIDAELTNGVLTIRLPRASAALPRKISVKGA